MQESGRYLFFAGIVISLLGTIVWSIGRTGLRGLPGDISFQNDHVRVYFPIVSCLVLSAIATLLALIWRRWSRQ